MESKNICLSSLPSFPVAFIPKQEYWTSLFHDYYCAPSWVNEGIITVEWVSCPNFLEVIHVLTIVADQEFEPTCSASLVVYPLAQRSTRATRWLLPTKWIPTRGRFWSRRAHICSGKNIFAHVCLVVTLFTPNRFSSHIRINNSYYK